MTSEKDLLQLRLDTSKIRSLSLNTLQFRNSKSNSKLAIKYPVFFSDANNVTALRREHSRIIQSNDKSANLVSVGLHILDNIVCLQNPSNLDVDYMHKLALAFFKQAERANNAFGTYLTGVANVYGYCGPIDIPTGLQQIKEAAKRKCADAQNFLGLYFARTNFVLYACRMFRAAAFGGHPLAPINYKWATQALQKQLQKARWMAMQKLRSKQRKMQRRNRANYYQLAPGL